MTTAITAGDADDAAIALLKTTGIPVHDGHVKDSDESKKTISAPLPYHVYFAAPGYPINRRAGGTAGRAQEFQVTSVGKTREQATWAGDLAEGVLDQALVSVDGRDLRITRMDDNSFTRRDDTWTRPDGGPLFTDVRRYVLAR